MAHPIYKRGHKAGKNTALRLHSSGALFESGLLKAFLNESIEDNLNSILLYLLFIYLQQEHKCFSQYRIIFGYTSESGKTHSQNYDKLLLASSCLPVCPSARKVTTRLPLDGFS